MNSSDWTSTAIFLASDVRGGFHGHVAPPRVDEMRVSVKAHISSSQPQPLPRPCPPPYLPASPHDPTPPPPRFSQPLSRWCNRRPPRLAFAN
ncbi:MAG: hypothetical protein ACYDAL_06310 [Candidatus Dormibacteraceae bacterium]